MDLSEEKEETRNEMKKAFFLSKSLFKQSALASLSLSLSFCLYCVCVCVCDCVRVWLRFCVCVRIGMSLWTSLFVSERKSVC